MLVNCEGLETDTLLVTILVDWGFSKNSHPDWHSITYCKKNSAPSPLLLCKIRFCCIQSKLIYTWFLCVCVFLFSGFVQWRWSAGWGTAAKRCNEKNVSTIHGTWLSKPLFHQKFSSDLWLLRSLHWNTSCGITIYGLSTGRLSYH